MFNLHLKKTTAHPHTVGEHHFWHMMQHLFQSEKFWAISAIVILLALLIALSIILSGQSSLPRAGYPSSPYFPYMP